MKARKIRSCTSFIYGSGETVFSPSVRVLNMESLAFVRGKTADGSKDSTK